MFKRFLIAVGTATLACAPVFATTAHAASESLPEMQVDGRDFVKVVVPLGVESTEQPIDNDDAIEGFEENSSKD